MFADDTSVTISSQNIYDISLVSNMVCLAWVNGLLPLSWLYIKKERI